jgi:hypothetical protein
MSQGFSRMHLKKPKLIKISPLKIFFNPADRKGKISTIKEKHITRRAYELLEDFQK